MSLAIRAPESHDMRAYWTDIAERTEAGERLYQDTPYHFPPPWAWVLISIHRLARPGFEFGPALRIFLNAIDAATAILLFRLAKLERAASPRAATLLFLLNPVGVWVSSVQGQFDNLAVLFLVAALLAFRGRTRDPSASRVSEGVWLGLSIAAKQVTVFHPLLWVRDRRGVLTAGLAYTGVLLFFLPYAQQWRAIGEKLLIYGSVPRSYGFSELVLADSRWAPVVGALDALAGVAAALWLSRFPRARASLAVFLVLLLFAPGLGAQYLVWPVALGSLFVSWRYLLFTGASMMWILGSHFGVPGSGRWMGHLVWFSVALWLAGELRTLLAARSSSGLAPSAPAPG